MIRFLKKLNPVQLLFFIALLGMCLITSGDAQKVGAREEAAATLRTDLPADIMAWLALMPELSTAPAPTWLKIGTRITYHVMYAAREGDNTPAGESIVQYDVVSNDSKTVLASTGVHVIGSGGSMGAVRDTGFVVGVPGVGDVWMNPTVLAKAEKHANKDFSITHTATNVNGVATKAVRFEYIQGASRSVSVFDELNGVLLYRIQASGTMDTAKQSSVVSNYISIRQMPSAWTGGATPAWAVPETVLRYEGTVTVNIGYGTPGQPLSLVMVGRITNTSAAGVCVLWQTYISGSLTEQRFSLTSSAIPSGGIFLPQAALTSLKAGKVLDSDPTTGVSVSVSPSSLVVNGKQLLVLVQEGRSFKRLFGYDRQTGMLTYYSERTQEGVTSVQTELKLVSPTH